MSICLLLISDGRQDYRARTIASAKKHLPKFDHLVEIDDSAHTLGFAGAIQAGWERALETGADHVFHLECDFTFDERIPVNDMVALLDREPEVAQVSLKRQPVNEREKAAGGIIEADPEDFIERYEDGVAGVVHRRYFTTNPSVYRMGLCRMGWPQEPRSEGVFTHQLLRDPLLRFAIWGRMFDPPRCEHIGDARAGHGY